MNEPRFGTAGLADSYTVKKFDPAAIAAYTAGEHDWKVLVEQGIDGEYCP